MAASESRPIDVFHVEYLIGSGKKCKPMQIILDTPYRKAYIKEPHSRTIFTAPRRPSAFSSTRNPNQIYLPHLVQFPKTFFILEWEQHFIRTLRFGHVTQSGLCLEVIGRDHHHYTDRKFAFCLGESKLFSTAETILDYFWNSVFYVGFPRISSPFGGTTYLKDLLE